VRTPSLSVVLVLSLARTASAQEPSIDLAEAERAFESAKIASDLDAGRLWGVEMYGPIFLVDPASGSVAADRADPEGELTARDGVWTGTLPESISPANTAIEWAGLEWTMVLWPPPTIPHARNRLLLHEMFHRVQDEIGLPANNPLNAHLDTRDGRIWMRLEMRALAEALSHDGDGRRAAIRDALDFRARRRAAFPAAGSDEDALERNEGMAEYTGLVLGGLPPAALLHRAAVGLELQESRETFSRSFAYATGPAYGVLLDAAGRPWRDALVAGATLDDLLDAAYPTEASRVPAEGRVAWYNGERVIAIETAREATRLAREAELRGRFVDGPVLLMVPGSEFSFSFDPNDAVNLDGIGTVDGTTRVVDGWGVLEVESGGGLFRRNEEGWITGVVVPVPADAASPPSAGDGWMLELAPGWEIVPGDRPGDWAVRAASAP
jgi:hypothetical protein